MSSESKKPLDKLEQLTLENIMLKEEILKRDFQKLAEQKDAFIKEILAKHNVDPTKQNFSIDINEITIVDKQMEGGESN